MNAIRKRSVLIVGESAVLRAKVRMGVERSGISSVILDASNAFEALALLTSIKVDLVLVSSKLHSMESRGLISRINKNTNGRSKCMMVEEDAEGTKEPNGSSIPLKGISKSLKRVEFWSKVAKYLSASEKASEKAVQN